MAANRDEILEDDLKHNYTIVQKTFMLTQARDELANINANLVVILVLKQIYVDGFAAADARGGR